MSKHVKGDFTRNCPECGEVIHHTERENRDTAVKNGRVCLKCFRQRQNRKLHLELQRRKRTR